MLTIADAEAELAGIQVVPVASGSMPDMKRLREQCLEADIPALVGCPPGAGKG